MISFWLILHSLLGHIRQRSWDAATTPTWTSCWWTVFAFHALGHHDLIIVVHILVIVRCRAAAGNYCGRSCRCRRQLLRLWLLSMYMLTGIRSFRRCTLHAIMLIDSLSIARIVIDTWVRISRHVMNLCLLLLLLLLRMHSISTHCMWIHLLMISVLLLLLLGVSRSRLYCILLSGNISIAKGIAPNRLGR